MFPLFLAWRPWASGTPTRAIAPSAVEHQAWAMANYRWIVLSRAFFGSGFYQISPWVQLVAVPSQARMFNR